MGAERPFACSDLNGGCAPNAVLRSTLETDRFDSQVARSGGDRASRNVTALARCYSAIFVIYHPELLVASATRMKLADCQCSTPRAFRFRPASETFREVGQSNRIIRVKADE
jgi:hypothetical protein